MLKKSKWCYLLTIVTAIILLAPGPIQLVSPAYADHCEKNHKKLPGCPGKDDGGNTATPLDVTFRCAEDSVCESVDRIRGDGNIYQHGVEKVTAIITQNGNFLLNVGAKNKPPARNVFFDFSQSPLGGIQLDAGFFADTGDLNNEYGLNIQANRRGSAQGFSLLDMVATAPSIDVDFWTDMSVFDPGSDSIVWVRFDKDTNSVPEAQNECKTHASVDVSIVRNSDTQWVISAPDGALACVRTLDNTNSVFNREDQVNMGAFEITLDLQ